MKMGNTASPWRYDAVHLPTGPGVFVSRRYCSMITPDFGWSHRLLPLNALTGHGCTNLATGREGGTVPKTIAILGSALFFVVAPSTLAGLIPWWITRWEFLPPFFDLQATRVVGILLIVAGLPGLVDSFARFALQGLGTPAPIAPTQNLVVTGLYRYVRNPIYVAVVAVILGQAILFGDWRLLDLRRAHVARLPRLCPGVRGAGACSAVWGRVRGFPGQRPAVDSAAVSMAHRIRPPAQWRRRGERGRQNSKPAAHYSTLFQ